MRSQQETDRIQRAVSYAVAESEQKYKHGQNAEKLQQAISFLKCAGYKITDAEAQALIEAEVERIKGTDKRKLPARDTDEFIEKYYRKRFTPANTGKAYLLSFLFDVYKGNSRQVNTTLWNLEALKEKIKTDEDMRSFDAYYHLTEWLRNLYENSRTMRNALRSVLADYYHITTSILSAENIRRCVIKTPVESKLATLTGKDFTNEVNSNPDANLTLWLNTLTLEAYTPQSGGAALIQSLRENIGEGLRYMVAYHTFLDVIADYTGIPECAFLKVKVNYLMEDVMSLNEALEALREDVKTYREPEIREYMASKPKDFTFDKVQLSPDLHDLLPASFTFWTPQYLSATMKNFQPIENVPPIPEERVNYLREYIKREFKTGVINWYVLYTWYSIKYRIPVPAATPPTGRKGTEIKMSIETAEGE